jgi:hypothetical protein
MSMKRIMLVAMTGAAVVATSAAADARTYRHKNYGVAHARYYRAPVANYGPRDYGSYGGGSYFYADEGAPPVTQRFRGPLYAGEDPIVRQPNGKYLGTDPDPNVRAYMRHDNIGPNGTPGGTAR